MERINHTLSTRVLKLLKFPSRKVAWQQDSLPGTLERGSSKPSHWREEEGEEGDRTRPLGTKDTKDSCRAYTLRRRREGAPVRSTRARCAGQRRLSGRVGGGGGGGWWSWGSLERGVEREDGETWTVPTPVSIKSDSEFMTAENFLRKTSVKT